MKLIIKFHFSLKSNVFLFKITGLLYQARLKGAVPKKKVCDREYKIIFTVKHTFVNINIISIAVSKINRN